MKQEKSQNRIRDKMLVDFYLQTTDMISLHDLYQFYEGKLFLIALDMLDNKCDAEDVVSAVKIKFLTMQEGKIRKVKNFEAFLKTCVKNQCIDVLRVRKKRQERESPLDDYDFLV